MSLGVEIFQSVGFVQKQAGWKAIPGFLIYPFFETFNHYILVGRMADAIPPIPPKLPLEIREATPQDAPKFSKIIPPLRIRRFMRKMEAGERCAVGILDDEVIYFAWASFAGQSTSKELPLALGPKDVYFWGAYCSPAYRQYGASASVSSYHEDLMRQIGCETGYRMVKHNNQPSLNLCKKLKLRIIGRVYGVRLFQWRFYRYSQREAQ